MEGSPDRQQAKKTSTIIGRQPVLESLQAKRPIDKVYLQANATGEIISQIRQLAKSLHIPVQVVPADKLNSFSRANHQGCIAMAAVVFYVDLQQVIESTTSAGKLPLFVMLDGVTDVRNIGGIARSAVCCGAQALIIPDKGVGALNEEAMKASAGALEKIGICRVGSLLKAIDELHLNGIRVFVSAMDTEHTLQAMDFREPCCIVMGSEGKGVQPYLIKAADMQFSIPMSGYFDSFNVSVAAGIILYEAMKQRL